MPKEKDKSKKWFNWEELNKRFGKLEYLYTLELAINKNFKISLDYDGRRKKPWQIYAIEKLKRSAKMNN